MSTQYLYRVQIVEYPAGSWVDVEYGSYPNPDWEPEGWAPDEEWIERFGGVTGVQFFWPTTTKEWRSRSSAVKRKKLIESYGARCIIQRSSRIDWPAEGFETIANELLSAAPGGAS